MMGHPIACWTFPHVERRRRAIAFAAGVLVGTLAAAAAFLAGAACRPFS